MLKDIHFIPQVGRLRPKLGSLNTKSSRLRSNLFSYNRLDDQRLLARTCLRGTNSQYITAYLHILSCSVGDTVNMISIGFTEQFNLQPQI